ncbi:hypothetical protein [Candidatus Nitrososphaera evergladensis]|uniref:hypothetical protein n=1 Tax=Candidatus Nitrososphaera evergladensis TaxID=1459637 RepID=UPI0011E5B65F|nr:hypothetical protein [Candidatus Nitrososphaera evergladensis]
MPWCDGDGAGGPDDDEDDINDDLFLLIIIPLLTPPSADECRIHHYIVIVERDMSDRRTKFLKPFALLFHAAMSLSSKAIIASLGIIVVLAVMFYWQFLASGAASQ